ncbi:MAG: hypothetical protein IT440_15465 [Phycisphaeraceae bacterium]|nr:hypothetical protein [Phycisphaeraceae bacterium]
MTVITDGSFQKYWTWLTVIGWWVAHAVANQITGWIFPEAVNEALGSSPVYYLIFGGILGLFQWWCLRGKIPHSMWWAVFTAGGLLFAGWLINKRLYRIESISISLQSSPILAHAILGVILGLAQYLFIRNKLVFASVWLIMFPLIWVVSTAIMGTSVGWLQPLGVFLFAICTGFMMERLLQLSTPSKNAA